MTYLLYDYTASRASPRETPATTTQPLAGAPRKSPSLM